LAISVSGNSDLAMVDVNAVVKNWLAADEKFLGPHAAEIGQIVIAWNSLQILMGSIFAAIMQEADQDLALAAWNSLESDRAQREMLRAVALKKFGEDSVEYQHISWMLTRANNSVSDIRNDTIHTPLTVLFDEGAKVIPDADSGNQRAVALSGSALIKVFRLYRANIKKLYYYTLNILIALEKPKRRSWLCSWPDKPLLQRPALSQIPKGRPRKNSNK
jgi:hypothetical protein